MGDAVEPRPLIKVDSFCVKEFVNGLRFAEGTIRFEKGRPASSDGSAKFAGTRFAVCSGAAVQIGSDGVHRAICYAAPRSCPQSACFCEMIGVDALAMVLSRGTLEDQRPHEAGAMTVGIYCSAVVGAFRRFCRGLAPGRFPFAGSFRHAALSAELPSAAKSAASCTLRVSPSMSACIMWQLSARKPLYGSCCERTSRGKSE